MRLPPHTRPRGISIPANDVFIVREHSGTPRIRSQTLLDGYYGLGFIHATDRLFQMFATRALAQGRLSEAFGDAEDLVASDQRARAGRFHEVSIDDLAGLGDEGWDPISANLRVEPSEECDASVPR